MRMTAISTQTERKRLDRFVRCAEQHRLRARTQRFRGLIHPAPETCAFADGTRGEKRLSSGRVPAILTSEGTITWGMSDKEVHGR